MNKIDWVAVAASAAAAAALLSSWQVRELRRSVRDLAEARRLSSPPLLAVRRDLPAEGAVVEHAGRVGALRYDGPAEIVTLRHSRVARVEAHLTVEPPAGDRFGRWFGQLLPHSGESFNGPIDLVEVIVRLPGGRTARAVLKGKSIGPQPSLELVGSGPPPF